MSDPTFVPVDLTELQDSGVLMAANERFFWPLGLALTWSHHDDGKASDLHIREWRFEDGHHEIIEIGGDTVTKERRRRWSEWLSQRIDSLPLGERGRAEQL